MLVQIHRPVVSEVQEFPAFPAFRLIQLRDGRAPAGVIDLFIEHDWSDWDRIVEAVEEHRRKA